MDENIIPYPFHWNVEMQTHLYGTGSNGIGIYFDEEDKAWRGNIVLDGNPTLFFGPFDGLEHAKVEMTKEYIKAQQEPE